MANGVKGSRTKAILGSHNVTCDVSGIVGKREDMRYTWDRKLVLKEYWDPKHPQLELKTHRERIAKKDVRTQGPQYFPPPPSASDL